MKKHWRIGLILFFIALISAISIHSIRVQNQEFNLRLLHTNDHHAHLEAVEFENQELGGIARRKTLIDRLRSEAEKPTLLLDAGDIFQGTLYFNQYQGQADLPFYNAMGYTAVAIGNHEFDRGQSILAKFIKKAKFPMIAANINIADNSVLKGLIKPWIILKIQDEKVGIFGLTTKETAILSNPGSGVTFTDPVMAAKNAVESLTQQGVNKIIALTHIGFLSDLKLAQQIDGIDVIIGGHSHTPVGDIPGSESPYPVVKTTPNGSKVLVVTDWEWGKYLGDLEVTFNPQGAVVAWQGSPHALDSRIQPDQAFETQLATFKTPMDVLRKQVIGKTQVKLEGDRAKIRTGETNLGNLIADAILNKVKPDGGQIAILNSGGIRASIPPGNVTVSQVLEVLPFGNTITRLDLTGEQIQQVLEHGLSQFEAGEGCFPQVAGIRFVWNPKAAVGSRMISIQVLEKSGQAKPLNPQATYRVVTNNFLMGGGDGYAVFKNGKNQIDTGFLLADVVIDYFITQSPVNLKPDNRIVAQKV